MDIISLVKILSSYYELLAIIYFLLPNKTFSSVSISSMTVILYYSDIIIYIEHH